ncbi:sulfotransferase family protein [Sphingobium sp. LB126]|uniref:sulfotransferase family protein n=1 Tax=Sphingobium sp. LB126 TaxID=1983755 RepID=UPI0012FD8BF9|nr:sulfotransferase family protein [Sphingobium sp. LB126]
MAGLMTKNELYGNNKDRSVVFVLGMHRSGTSALSRMLNLLGCDLPKTLMPGTQANPHGYWESEAIMEINDAILHSGGSEWIDWLPFNPDWRNSPVYRTFLKKGQAALRDEYGSSSLFVMKDPRCARIAPFWLDVFDQEGLSPLIIIPVRNVLEVASSLTKRNGFHRDYGCLLWLRHVLDAEFDTRGKNRAFTTYDELLHNWGALARRLQDKLGIYWPSLSASTGRKISDFLNPDDRHSTQSLEDLLADLTISNWFKDTYAIMLRWAADGEAPVDYDALDTIRYEFNAACPAFIGIAQALMHESQHSREIEHNLHHKGARICELEETIATYVNQEADLNHKLHISQGNEREYIAEVNELKEKLSASESTVNQNIESIACLQNKISSTEVENLSKIEILNDIVIETQKQIDQLRSDRDKEILILSSSVKDYIHKLELDTSKNRWRLTA